MITLPSVELPAISNDFDLREDGSAAACAVTALEFEVVQNHT